MIKLKDILKELDYGDKLWADPTYTEYGLNEDEYTTLIKKRYKNTPTEGFYIGEGS